MSIQNMSKIYFLMRRKPLEHTNLEIYTIFTWKSFEKHIILQFRSNK